MGHKNRIFDSEQALVVTISALLAFVLVVLMVSISSYNCYVKKAAFENGYQQVNELHYTTTIWKKIDR